MMQRHLHESKGSRGLLRDARLPTVRAAKAALVALVVITALLVVTPQVATAQETTTTTITSVSSDFLAGDPMTINVVVTAASGTPTGTVTVTDGGTGSCPITLSGGGGNCQITESTADPYTLTASYGGDSNDDSSTSSGFDVTVGGDATTTSLTIATASPVVGQPITVDVSVGGGSPTGTVTVTDGTQVCTADLSDETPSCAITETAVGTYGFTATYNGDSTYSSSNPSSPSSVTVGQDSTTASVTGTTPTSPVVGEAFSVDVSVSVNSPGAGTPTGSVLVSDGTQNCTVTSLSGGVGSCPLTETSVGTYELTATYNGDSNDAASPTSSEFPVTVGEDSTTASVTGTSPASPVVGESFSVDVSVTVDAPGAGTPTGSVLVTDGTQNCTASLSDGSGSCSITGEASVGTYDLTATYNGDPNDAASPPSTVFPVTVGQDSTTASITGTSPTNPVVGQSFTVDVSVTVNSPGVGTPTGTVTVSDGTQECTTGDLVDGAASCQLTETSAKTYDLTATYNGDADDAASPASTEFPVTVGQDSTTASITATSPTSPVVGQPITVDVSVGVNSPGAGTPGGTVTVSDGSQECTTDALVDGAGSCQLTEASATGYELTATYNGDANDLASPPSTEFPVVVGQDSTTASVTGTSPTSPVVGEQFSVDVSVGVNAPGAGTPTGSVLVIDGTQNCIAHLSGGVGSCPLTETSTKTYELTATYNGDTNDASSPASAEFPVGVGLDDTTTDISSTSSSYVVGQPITVDVSVAASSPGAGTPTGTVTVSDGTNNCPATLSGGAGSCTLTETAAGPYTLAATYNGDTNDNTSVSNGLDITVGQDETTTDISSTSSTYKAGDSITVNVSVATNTPGSGTPTGSVTVSDGVVDGETCLATLLDGTGSCKITEPSQGDYTLTATYNGDTNDKTSKSSGFDITVGGDPTTTDFTSITGAPVVGQPITADVNVSVNAPYDNTPTGTVTVSDGTNNCPATLSGGAGSCQLTETTPGPYTFTGTYSGDSTDASSDSAGSKVTVSKASSTTALNLSHSEVTYGDEGTETFSFTVSPEFIGSPTGTVTLRESTTTLCQTTLASSAGTCTLNSEQLPAGSYEVVASYGGDANFDSSPSTEESLTVLPASSATTLTLSGHALTYGDEGIEHLTVTVAPEFAGSEPTGSVTVKESTTTLCTTTLTSGAGTCTLLVTQLPVGSYDFMATYGGDANFSSSASAAEAVTVSPASSTTALNLSHSHVTYGHEQSESISVTVAPEYAGSPSGTVVVKASATTLCDISLSSSSGSCLLGATKLAAGAYDLVASYSGDSNFAASASARMSLTVGKATAKVALRLSASTATFGHLQIDRLSVTVSPEYAGSPTGTVAVKESTTALCTIRLSSKHYCTLAAMSLGTGKHHLVASYGGDSNFDASTSASGTLNVGKATSKTILTLSPVKGAHGQESEHASVTVLPEYAGTPTGTVTLKKSATTLCVFTLSSARGSCTVAALRLGAGKYHLVANYSGSSDFDPSVSAAQSVTITKTASRTTLTLSTTKVTYGNEQVEHFSVAVSPVVAGPTPTGSVKVKESTTTLCVIKLSAGKGTCALSAEQLAAGSYHVVAVYSGSSNLAASTSATKTLTVNVARV